jgi:hypothetical protein
VWDSQGSNFVHKKKEMGGACSKYGERCVQVLVSKPKGNSVLGRPRHRWEDNTKMVVKEWCGGVDRAYLLQDRDK